MANISHSALKQLVSALPTGGTGKESAVGTVASVAPCEVLLDGASAPAAATASCQVSVGDRVSCELLNGSLLIIGIYGAGTAVKASIEGIQRRVMNAEASIVVTDEAVQLRATKTEVQSAMESEHSSMLEVTADAIESAVTDAQSYVDGIMEGTDSEPGLLSRTSNLEQRADGFTASIETVKSMASDAQSTADENMVTIRKYMSFGGTDSEPVLELGSSASAFKTQLTNSELAFIEDGSKVAYVSGQKLNIRNADIGESMGFGGFRWVKRENGNMALKWVGE